MILLTAFLCIGRVIVPLRPNVPGWQGSFEALAHLIVGFMIGVSFYDRRNQLQDAQFCGWLGWFAAFWELGLFLGEKYGR